MTKTFFTTAFFALMIIFTQPAKAINLGDILETSKTLKELGEIYSPVLKRIFAGASEKYKAWRIRLAEKKAKKYVSPIRKMKDLDLDIDTKEIAKGMVAFAHKSHGDDDEAIFGRAF